MTWLRTFLWGWGGWGSHKAGFRDCHLQVPAGGQVLHGAQARHLQEQFHPVDYEQEQQRAVSSALHTWAGSASSLRPFRGLKPPPQAVCSLDSQAPRGVWAPLPPRLGMAQPPSVHPAGIAFTSSVPGIVLGAGHASDQHSAVPTPTERSAGGRDCEWVMTVRSGL